jgi:hypothetical protein
LQAKIENSWDGKQKLKLPAGKNYSFFKTAWDNIKKRGSCETRK